MPLLLQRPGVTGAVLRFWETSYASDYVGLLLLLIVDGLIQSYVEPFHRLFRIDNQPLHYPFATSERVPVPWLFAFGLGIPVLVLFVWAVALRPPIHKVHVTYLGLIISIFLTVFLTDVIKNAVGRPRPDLIARCHPHLDTPRNQLVQYNICDQADPHILHDGWRSFPSGHSSFAFAGLGYLSLFFASQFHILHPVTSLPTLLLTISPLVGALLIAISRCEDYRHDVYDVTCGSILGMTIAWVAYRRYYPSLTSRRCETPWPSKSEMMAAAVKWYQKKERDEEERVGVSSRGNNDMVNGAASRPANGGVDGSGEDSEDDIKRGLLRGTSTPR